MDERFSAATQLTFVDGHTHGWDVPVQRRGRDASTVRVALVIPLSGPAGLWGPSCANCAVLAQREVNETGGMLGRPLELVTVDGGSDPRTVGARVRSLVRAGEVDAVVGMHTSDVRLAVVTAVGDRVPYVYTPPYEGGERSPTTLLTGETPGRQLAPTLRWLVERQAARRWFLVGNDYVWPRASHRAARHFLAGAGGSVVGEEYLPFNLDDHGPCLDRIAAARPDAVLVNLVGDEQVRFHRAFADRGLAARTMRLSASLEENTLLGMGGDASGGLYATLGYFSTLVTDASLGLLERYVAMFGPDAPVLNDHGESCYEGLMLLAAVVRRAGTLEPYAVAAAAEGARFTGARGARAVHSRHADQPVYLAQADGLDFHVVASF